MKELLKDVFESFQWVVVIVGLVIGIVSLITWLTAQAAIQFVAPIVVYFTGGAICLVILLWMIDHSVNKVQSTRLTLATTNRDITLANNEKIISNNEAMLSDISVKSATLRLAAEHGLLGAQSEQMAAGAVYIQRLGEAVFASHSSANAKRLQDGTPLLYEPLPKLITLIPKTQRILIAGGQNAGKTTICQWIAYTKLQQGRVIVIDSHATPARWPSGCEVIGAGRDYDKIEDLLKWMLAEMDRRFKEQASGKVRERGHEIVTVVSDEWTLLPEVIPDVEKYTTPLLTETRKAGFDFYLAAHDTTVDALGIRGKGGLRKAFDFAVLCDYDFASGERHTYVNYMKAGRVSEKDNIEYEPPGPFVVQGEAQPVNDHNDGTPLLGEPTGDIWDFSQETENLVDQQVIDEYLKTQSYSRAFRLLYKLTNGSEYEGAIGGNQRAKVKEILDRHNVIHPVGPGK